MNKYYTTLKNINKTIRKFQEGGAAPEPVETTPAPQPATTQPTPEDPMEALKAALKKAIDSKGEDCQSAFDVVNILDELMNKKTEEPAEAPMEEMPAARRGMKNKMMTGARMYGYYEEGDEFNEETAENSMQDEEGSESPELTPEQGMGLFELYSNAQSDEDLQELEETYGEFLDMDEEGNPMVDIKGYGVMPLERLPDLMEHMKKAARGMRMAPAVAQPTSNFFKKVAKRSN